MNLEQMVATTMMKPILRTPRGRALLLAQTAEAEDNGEAVLFDQALEWVDDPRFRKMIERHQSDEIRHGRMFRECARRQGVDVGALPDELKVLEHLDVACDGFFSRPLSSIEDVVRAFALLQALEERAVVQFAFFGPLFGRYDPETGAVFAEVAKDEARHLLYCRAITRHYAPDAQSLEAELARARRAEAVAFRKTEKATAAHLDRMEVIESPILRAVWRALTGRDASPRPAFELLVA